MKKEEDLQVRVRESLCVFSVSSTWESVAFCKSLLPGHEWVHSMAGGGGEILMGGGSRRVTRQEVQGGAGGCAFPQVSLVTQ